MDSTLTARFDADGFQAFASATQEPEWLLALRREAFDHAEKMQWPERRHEEWIRTDIRAFQLAKFGLPEFAAAPNVGDTSQIHQLLGGVDLGGRIETINSFVSHQHLDEDLASKGVIFGSLSDVAAAQPELVRQYLFTAFDPDHDKFAALHAAFMSGGQFLYVPRGVVVDRPLHIGSILSDGGTDTTHTLVVIEDGAEATLLHESNSVDRKGGGLHLGGVELLQKPGSHLRYVNLQEWGLKSYHFAQQKATIDRDCTLQWTLAAMGSMLSKVNQSVDLVGPGANSQVNGVMFTEGRQHLAYHTQQYHRAESCRSDFLYKAAQQDKSRTVWRGM
ncbi:MAG: SufD family Fe-S cluster assembly protein, partial [Planctomycetota bacterium]